MDMSTELVIYSHINRRDADRVGPQFGDALRNSMLADWMANDDGDMLVLRVNNWTKNLPNTYKRMMAI